jgi:hypothetical protein
MKKFIFAIYTVILIAIMPAIFIAYLNHAGTPKTTEPVTNHVNAVSPVANDETSFKPGSIIILKGI